MGPIWKKYLVTQPSVKQFFTLRFITIAFGLSLTMSCSTYNKSIDNNSPLQGTSESAVEKVNNSDFSESRLLGAWGARYISANGDGYYNDYIIFKKGDQKIEAIRWSVAKCNRCKTSEGRKPYISDFPKATLAENGEKLITQMKLQLQSNQLVEIGNSPLGEDIVFSSGTKITIEPFIAECNSGKFIACYYLGEMLAVEGRKSEAAGYWKKACRNKIIEACGRLNGKSNQ